MNREQWTAVDHYIADRLVPSDTALSAALEASDAAGLPAINVSPTQGKFLMLLARIQGARNILEIGTLGGYSTIWLARALPAGGRLVTLEADAKHASVARANLERAGLDGAVEVREGPALETLPQLVTEGGDPFDLIFIDADKPNAPDYVALALKRSRPGSVIVVDNVVRGGDLIDAESMDAGIQGIRRLYDMLATDSRLTATAMQTVGGKGYDGFAIALVTGSDEDGD
jgi:predicted O-methyltransferase YrrM